MKRIALLTFFILFCRQGFAEENQFVVRLGNESNPVDGFFGPATYGLHVNYLFQNSMSTELTYMRMHEPNTPTFDSVLDDGQFILRFPEVNTFTIDVTGWKNRMIDMYTNLVGVELTHKNTISPMIGAYVGTATRDDVSGNFQGLQIGATTNVGFAEIGASCLFGKIDSEGSYRHCGVDAGIDFKAESSVPLTLTFSIEERAFDFGPGRPSNEAADEYIFVTGLEIHLEKLF
jgi:hypothetical protein